MSSWATRKSFPVPGGQARPWASAQARIRTDKVATRAKAVRPTGKPLARMSTPRVPYLASSKGMTNDLVKRLTGISKLFEGRLNRQQKNALQTMHTLLGPEKFGGKDRTLHFGDQQAIVRSLMKDSRGLGKVSAQRLARSGKTTQAKVVEKAFSGQLGFLGKAVRRRVTGSAQQVIETQLRSALKAAKVDTKTSGYYDDVSRKISFRDAAKFQRAFKVFRSMQRGVEKKLGVDLVFVKGISQDCIAHILDGSAGFPPGIALRDRKRVQ